MKANYTINQELNGIEITFDSKPEAATLEALKSSGYRWHRAKKLWYAKNTAERLSLAQSIADGEAIANTETKKKPESNFFGVKVGDFFRMSWGYEQTQNDFFQVIALVGEKSVRIREVNPAFTSSPVSGMSEDRQYKLDTSTILPPSSYSIHIKDQEKGDLKRLKSYAKDGKSNPQINMASYANAYYCGGSTCECYESWYY